MSLKHNISSGKVCKVRVNELAAYVKTEGLGEC